MTLALNSSHCPTPEVLNQWVQGELSDDHADRIVEHLEDCVDCEQTVHVLESTGFLRKSATTPNPDILQEARCRTVVESLQDRDSLMISGPVHAMEHGKLRDYVLLEILGQGAMGTVFKARHAHLNKLVAIKVMSEELSNHPTAVARFQREMRAVGQLQHPNVVQALDAGQTDGVLYLAMEFVNGADLGKLVANQQPLNISDACELVRQAAIGLQHAHTQGQVHRDIKPSNLMLTRDENGNGRVKVLDLGLALISDPNAVQKLTDPGQLLGTLNYMAPELAEQTRIVDHRADIYSLGVTLYRLLTGRVPFEGPNGNTPIKRIKALTTTDPPSLAEHRSGLPAALVQLVDRMLSRNPDQRPQSMSEVAAAMSPFAATHQLECLLEH